MKTTRIRLLLDLEVLAVSMDQVRTPHKTILTTNMIMMMMRIQIELNAFVLL